LYWKAAVEMSDMGESNTCVALICLHAFRWISEKLIMHTIYIHTYIHRYKYSYILDIKHLNLVNSIQLSLKLILNSILCKK